MSNKIVKVILINKIGQTNKYSRKMDDKVQGTEKPSPRRNRQHKIPVMALCE
jgi:hypothetical protein